MANFGSILIGHFNMHKPLISEEFIHYITQLSSLKYPGSFVNFFVARGEIIRKRGTLLHPNL